MAKTQLLLLRVELEPEKARTITDLAQLSGERPEAVIRVLIAVAMLQLRSAGVIPSRVKRGRRA